MKSVLMLYQWERYEGSEDLGIFSDDEDGKKLAIETAEKYLKENARHMAYSSSGITLKRVMLNRPDLTGRVIREW